MFRFIITKTWQILNIFKIFSMKANSPKKQYVGNSDELDPMRKNIP